ncbi:hypothetical protein ANN_01975 [Periplaneta americana]|uniref:Protein rolling stone-like n=1 Tax=Periplaneta americana TaxID=6978 RepID=A0ABQ8TW56_PERAM|nr:hypothetical protein ANN_01975 [Periplaneta americana]
MMKTLWRREINSRCLGFSHEQPGQFVKSQWQRNEGVSIVYLAYRWLFAVFFLSVWIFSFISARRQNSPTENFLSKWPIYLTNWGYSLCTAQALLGAGLVTHRLVKERVTGSCDPYPLQQRDTRDQLLNDAIEDSVGFTEGHASMPARYARRLARCTGCCTPARCGHCICLHVVVGFTEDHASMPVVYKVYWLLHTLAVVIAFVCMLLPRKYARRLQGVLAAAHPRCGHCICLHVVVGFTEGHASMPVVYKVYWLLHTLAVVIAFGITGSYFVVDYDPAVHTLSSLNLLMHAFNSVLMVLDLLVVDHPFRLFHFCWSLLFIVVYFVFTVVYHFSGGTGKHNMPFIYPALNWAKPAATVPIAILGTLSVFVSHVCTWLVVLARRRIAQARLGSSIRPAVTSHLDGRNSVRLKL